MALMTVTKISKARSGKPLVYFDNRHGVNDAYIVADGCTVPQERLIIDADTKSWEYRGNTYWGLNDWKPVRGTPATPVAGNGQTKPVESPAQTLKGWDVLPGDLSRFVSNVIGSAIEAKLILKPGDINAWTVAAYRSAQRMTDGSYASEWPEGPDPATHSGNPDPDEDDIPY